MKLTILATSDTHGFIYPTNYIKENLDLPFGLAKAVSAMQEFKETPEHQVIKIDNGDFLQGSPYAYYAARELSPAEPVRLTQAYRAADYECGVLGNHEFNYGKDYLMQAVASLPYPFLAANIVDGSGRPAFGPPFKIVQKGALKVAILGLTTAYIPHWEKPENINGLQFLNIVETAEQYIPILKEQADVVIVAYHGGFECDLSTGEPTEQLTGENEGYRLLKEVPGIDALVTGHQHRQIATSVNGVPVVQPGYRGEKVGQITLEIDDHTNQVIATSATLMDTANFPINHGIETLTKKTQEAVEDWLDQPLGTVQGDMTIKDSTQIRLAPSAYISFINQVQMAATGVKISGTALFNNEGTGFGAKITMRDVMTNYIYPNTLAVEQVTGAELKAALEQSAKYFILAGDQIAVNPRFLEPKPQHYNYDMYTGIEYTIDLTKPMGERITSISFEGQAIEASKTYEVVLNQYRAGGGGNYQMFSTEKIIRENQKDMTELIADYLHEHPTIKAEAIPSFKIIK